MLAEQTLAKLATRLAEVSGLKPGSPELRALLKLSAACVEKIVREVMPGLTAELIRENQAKRR